jgi:hypothetical protein
MPPMSIETVKKAEPLIQERERIARAQWNAVVARTATLTAQLGAQRPEQADEQLQLAIEEFRKASWKRSTLSYAS